LIAAALPGNTPDDVEEALGRLRLRLGNFGENIRWYSQVGSTNDVALSMAEQGWPEGTLVGADMQSSGRGRHGRVWASPGGAGIYLSVILRPDHRPATLLTIATGVAVCAGIAAATGLRPDLKWPNDALLSGRKVAGILAEAGTGAGSLQHVVVGIGINVMPAAYPPEVEARATSLEGEVGRPVDRGLVLAETLAALHERYGLLKRGRHEDVIAEWRSRAAGLLGREVEWQADSETRSGIARDIDTAGALIVDTPTGPARVIAGTVTWR
jgi:BirA family biotin operon repressor/biotin-[acetyl-CoA-carboxylase] ligase